jgi:alkylhydroperoxidase/carboxymuconolactone decarboxylase family protein YurZ
MAAGVPNVSTILQRPKLEALRTAFKPTEAYGFLSSILPLVYEKSDAYNRAISTAFYGDQPSDEPSPARQQLSDADRERCLIALLTSRGGADNLATHIYLALMEGVSVEEVANVIMLAAIYSGVDRFTTALSAYITTLKTLVALVDGGKALNAPAVIGELRIAFDPTAQLEALKKTAAQASQTPNSSRTGTLVPR